MSRNTTRLDVKKNEGIKGSQAFAPVHDIYQIADLIWVVLTFFFLLSDDWTRISLFGFFSLPLKLDEFLHTMEAFLKMQIRRRTGAQQKTISPTWHS